MSFWTTEIVRLLIGICLMPVIVISSLSFMITYIFITCIIRLADEIFNTKMTDPFMEIVDNKLDNLFKTRFMRFLFA